MDTCMLPVGDKVVAVMLQVPRGETNPQGLFEPSVQDHGTSEGVPMCYGAGRKHSWCEPWSRDSRW